MAVTQAQPTLDISKTSTLVEVCYDGGTAYMESRSDHCGRLVTGEALKLYTINSGGEWEEIESPDLALLDPDGCSEGCCKDSADICFTNGTYTVQTKANLDLSGEEPVVLGGIIVDAGGDPAISGKFTGEVPSSGYVPIPCQYSVTSETPDEFDCYLKEEPTNTLYNNANLLSRTATNIYSKDAQFTDSGNDLTGSDDAAPHPNLERDDDGVLVYNGSTAIAHNGNNSFANSGSANGGVRRKAGYWIVPEFHQGEPVSKATLRWAGTASYSQFAELKLAQDAGKPSQVSEDLTTYPLTDDEFTFNPEWYGSAVRYDFAVSDLGNGSGGILYWDIETAKENGTTGTYNNINPMLYGSSLDSPPSGGQQTQQVGYKRNRTTGIITDASGDVADINLTDGTLQAVDCGDLPLSGSAYVDPIARSVSVSGIFGGTGPYQISIDGGLTFVDGSTVSLSDEQEFIDVVIKDSKGQISSPLYTGWNTEYPDYKHCWTNAITEAPANATQYEDGNGLSFDITTEPHIGTRTLVNTTNGDYVAAESTANTENTYTTIFGRKTATSLQPERAMIDGGYTAVQNELGVPIGASFNVLQRYEGVNGDQIKLSARFIDLVTGLDIGTVALRSTANNAAMTIGSDVIQGNKNTGGTLMHTDTITGTGNPFKVEIQMLGSTGSDSMGHYLSVNAGHFWKYSPPITNQYAKRENGTYLRNNLIDGVTNFDFEKTGTVEYDGNYQFGFTATSSAMNETSMIDVQYSKDGGATWETVSTSSGTVNQNQSAKPDSEPHYNNYLHQEGIELSAGDQWPIYRVKTDQDGNEWVRVQSPCVTRRVD